MEGSGSVRLINLMKMHGYNKDLSVSLATVTEQPPEIKIKIDGMKIVLDKNDLIIAEHLCKHIKKYKVLNPPQEIGTCDTGYHANAYPPDYIFEMEFQDELKTGDRVIVVSDNDQVYYVMDRAVIM